MEDNRDIELEKVAILEMPYFNHKDTDNRVDTWRNGFIKGAKWAALQPKQKSKWDFDKVEADFEQPKQEAIDPETKNVFNYGYNEQEQTELYLENQELKKRLQATEGDAVEFAEWLTDNRIVSFFSKVTFGYHYARFKLFKNKR